VLILKGVKYKGIEPQEGLAGSEAHYFTGINYHNSDRVVNRNYLKKIGFPRKER
jgi:hypothetical protein